jgi:hypothetical protein
MGLLSGVERPFQRLFISSKKVVNMHFTVQTSQTFREQGCTEVIIYLFLLYISSKIFVE